MLCLVLIFFQIVHRWLESVYDGTVDEPVTTQRNVIRQHTMDALAAQRHYDVMRRSHAPLVTELDPDATDRQGRQLHEHDQDNEEQLLLAVWRYVRAGRLDAAKQLCEERGQGWRAASLEGGLLFGDSRLDDPFSDRTLFAVSCHMPVLTFF